MSDFSKLYNRLATYDEFKELMSAGKIPDQTVVEALGTQGNKNSVRYYGSMSIAEHLASIIAEKTVTRMQLLGAARDQRYDEIVAELLSFKAFEQQTAPQQQRSTHSKTRSAQP